MLNKIAKIMQMDDAVWLRHANPWSVWTRVAGLIFLIISIWSRDWIGIYSLIPIFISVLWIMVNPGFFSSPKEYRNWASQSVLGEKIYLSTLHSELPTHHRTLPKILNLVSVSGAILIAIGLFRLDFNQLLIGTVIQLGSKLWYLDRMVWLYADMKQHPNKIPADE